MTEKESNYNQLKDEPSSYLQQHARNLVNWYPWSERAWTKAKKENKPVFLSIGYASCHWCHVMEEESFANNEAIGQYLNENFISIKVDREQDPDLDAYFQEVNALFGKRGGWPLSIFLTPEKIPFFTGTYFPAEPKYGMTSFLEILKIIKETFEKKKRQIENIKRSLENYFKEKEMQSEQYYVELEEEMQESKPNMLLNPENELKIGQSLALSQKQGKKPFFSHKELEKMYSRVLDQMDEKEGGFIGAPKFPNFPMFYALFNQIVKGGKEAEERKLVEFSLDQMAYKGLYDHLGGGFHRYSVDAHWYIPHFEKMLYDNAVAIGIYAQAGQLFSRPDFILIAQHTANFLLTEMQADDGGIYAALDADTEHEEGKYYVWDYHELETSLTEEELKFLKEHFIISKSGNFEGKIHLIWSKPAPTARLWQSIRGKLLDLRNKRLKPFTDHNIILAWNALFLQGMLQLFKVSQDRKYLDESKKIFRFLEKYLCLFDEKGEITECHHMFNAQTQSGFGLPMLDDISYLAKAYVLIFEVTQEERYKNRALSLINYALENFRDSKGIQLVYSMRNEELFFQPTRVDLDQPMPSPSFMLVESAMRLAYFSDNERLKDHVEFLERFAKSQKQLVQRNITAAGTALTAAQFGIYEHQVIKAVGTTQTLRKLRRQLKMLFLPFMLIEETAQEKPPSKAMPSFVSINYCHDTLCSVIMGGVTAAIKKIQKEASNVDKPLQNISILNGKKPKLG